MINKITIKNEASYQGEAEVMNELKKINFFYGANGSGKTTISKVIRHPHKYSECEIKWQSGRPLQTLVYNRDFVKETFNQEDGIPGVFTLGDSNDENVKQIKKLQNEIKEKNEKIGNLNIQLNGSDVESGKKGKLKKVENNFMESCWTQKFKYDKDFKKVFEGFRNNKERFAEQVKNNFNNVADLKDVSELKDKYQSLFGDDPIEEQKINSIDILEVNNIQTKLILDKPIVGRKDVDIAALIDRLKASDWVKDGYQKYYDAEERICPFCQQKTTENLAKSLQDYFDESYNKSIEDLKSFLYQYETETKKVVQAVNNIIDNKKRWIDIDSLNPLIKPLETTISDNIERINKKIKEPSTTHNLDNINQIVDEINDLITGANEKIGIHNKTVANLKNEQSILKNQVWKFIVDDALDSIVTSYQKEKSSLDKAINNISLSIDAANERLAEINKQLKPLIAQTTTIQKTIDDINEILDSFGFKGFKLEIIPEEQKYRIVRPDNPDAQSSLSEGEISFVTFLYFYFLIKGTQDAADNIDDRVIVFDDPVSSLDNEVLFVVSNLIQDTITKATNKESNIKQIVVLTHNAYFFRQLTYKTEKTLNIKKEIKYWIVRKGVTGSRVTPYDKNPIKCTYQLMWDEYRSTKDNYHVLPNIMRRILESYFNLLGGKEIYRISDKFDGKDKLVCESLITWINVESHGIFEDANYSINENNVDQYKDVFKQIFEKTQHLDHYNMMMKLEGACS